MNDLPRVHEILNLIYPLGWVDQGALEYGAEAHASMEMLCRLDEQGCKSDYIGDDPRVDRAWDWYRGRGLQSIYVEKEFESKLGFVGHPDLVCKRRLAPHSPNVWVYDWKFAEQLTEANYMQAEAYRMLVPHSRVALIHIPKEGPVKKIVCKPNPYLKAVFLAGLTLLKHQRKG